MTGKEQKEYVIDELIEIQNKIDDMLSVLLPACPECCPPQFPCARGEVADHGQGEISMCSRCLGRGYLYPENDE